MSETGPISPENTDKTRMKQKARKPRTRGNLNNPNFAELGRPYRWRKGQPSPNPGGRPKAQPLTKALRELLEIVDPRDDLTAAQKLAEAQVVRALRGSLQHFHEIANRVEGMPTQRIEQALGPYEVESCEPQLREMAVRIARIMLEPSRAFKLPLPEFAQEVVRWTGAVAEAERDGLIKPKP